MGTTRGSRVVFGGRSKTSLNQYISPFRSVKIMVGRRVWRAAKHRRPAACAPPLRSSDLTLARWRPAQKETPGVKPGVDFENFGKQN